MYWRLIIVLENLRLSYSLKLIIVLTCVELLAIKNMSISKIHPPLFTVLIKQSAIPLTAQLFATYVTTFLRMVVYLMKFLHFLAANIDSMASYCLGLRLYFFTISIIVLLSSVVRFNSRTKLYISCVI